MNSRIEKACYNILLNAGKVPKEEVERIFQASEGSQLSFSQMIVQSGVLKESEMLQIYSKSLGVPYVNLKDVTVDKVIFTKIPAKFAWYYRFFPLKLQGQKLTLAISRMLDVNVMDEIRFGLGYEIETALAPERDIEDMLKKHYGLGANTADKILTQPPGKDSPGMTSISAVEVEDLEKLAETASVGQLVNQIILDAYQKHASDIHLEPYRGNMRLRYRIDGRLHEAAISTETKKFFSAIISRVKIMANLNIVERRLPQDGKARVKTQNETLDLRISSIPTPHGESIVIRILPTNMIFNFEQLGFETQNSKIFEKLLKKPHGIIFVTGPTGSGKSTTLYAALHTINTEDLKVVTIEDPVEYELEGITQIQTMPEIGLTFAQGLRSVLRHDPDVLMVGEVRDLETADISIRAALTGHLILSTLHTNDAASGVTRLLDIGVEPYLVSSSVNAFIAQRLVRVICPHCKEEDRSALPEIKRLIRFDLGLEFDQEVKVFVGKGCNECGRSGFRGRVAIHEILLVDEAIRKLIFERSSAEEIRRKAAGMGMLTLRQDGWRKVLRGVTTPGEIMEAVPPSEDEEKKSFFLQNSNLPVEESKENRKYYRSKVKLRLIYRVTTQAPAGEAIKRGKLDLSEHEGQTENISASGTCFYTDEAVQADDLLELKMDIQDGGEPMSCVARVLRVQWMKQPGDEGKPGQFSYQAAVSFLVISSGDRTRLEKFVKDQRVNEAV